nr:probable calcium-binding protein CML48 [Tanacetum cinerariifolium]
AIFERFDRDRSGKIDLAELRDALYSLGYAIPPSVLQLLISKYDDQSGRRVDLSFDSFVECGMIVKGLTEKFKEKDTRDRSGKIDLAELRDALYSLGYAIPPSVLQLLISKYDDQSGRRVDLSFDSFVECGMIVKVSNKFIPYPLL